MPTVAPTETQQPDTMTQAAPPTPDAESSGNGSADASRSDGPASGRASSRASSPRKGQPEWQLRVHHGLDDIDPLAWDALLAASDTPTPFLRHAYLAAMHDSRSACDASGWQPVFVTLQDVHGTLAGACPLYLKSHSYGEYVFDWAWADAYQRPGHAYYPKLLGAVPFTPVPGSRLLARDESARRGLLAGLEQFMRQQKLSSTHLLFMSEADRASAAAAGWLMRSTVQFHWHNRHVTDPGQAPYPDFETFLASLQREKRKKIQQERRQVRDAEVTFRTLRGPEITTADWDFFYRCYVQTYQEHRSTPYLTRDFFNRMADTMAGNWLLFVAERDGAPLAASLIALDPERQVAYGRYWGAVESIRCLHFEACYYQPLAWCIAQGWRRFEGGAQGEHKMARGLMPVQTWSAHKLSHPAFEDAVANYLEREGAGIEAYVDELRAHSPFKAFQAEPAG